MLYRIIVGINHIQGTVMFDTTTAETPVGLDINDIRFAHKDTINLGFSSTERDWWCNYVLTRMANGADLLDCLTDRIDSPPAWKVRAWLDEPKWKPALDAARAQQADSLIEDAMLQIRMAETPSEIAKAKTYTDLVRWRAERQSTDKWGARSAVTVTNRIEVDSLSDDALKFMLAQALPQMQQIVAPSSNLGPLNGDTSAANTAETVEVEYDY